MILELAVIAQLAAKCAPYASADTLAAIMQAESGFNTLAISVNGLGGRAIFPETRESAIAAATDLIVNQGRSVDLGLMQVNSANLAGLGLLIEDAFDACRNIAAGARILRAGYATALRTEAEPQRALRVAFSRYNTGNDERGFRNGYVARVQSAAEVVVPAIRLSAEAPAFPQPARVPSSVENDSDEVPEWDVWVRAPHQSSRSPTAATTALSPAATSSSAYSENPSAEARTNR